MHSASSQDAKSRLLGLSTCLPSPELSNKSPFSTNEKYLEFLKESQSKPEDYWMKIADELSWDERPKAVGKPGDWFPGGLINIASICLEKSIERRGENAPCISELNPQTDEPVSISLGELRRNVCKIQAHLDTWNTPTGSPILVALPGGSEMIACILACLRSGHPVVPIDPTYSKSRIAARFLMGRCQGALCSEQVTQTIFDNDKIDLKVRSNIATPQNITGKEYGERAAKALPPMHPAFILADSLHRLYSIPSAGFAVQAISAYQHLLGGTDKHDLLWTLAPSHHASTLATIVGALIAGHPVGTLPISKSKDIESFQKVVEKTAASILFADVKTVLEAISPALEENLRPLLNGPDIFIIEGETLAPRVWNYVRRGLFNGQTHIAQVLSRPESGGFLAGPNPRVTPVRVSSVGLPAPGIDLSVIELKEGECPVGEGGILALSKPIPGLAIELQSTPLPLPLQVKARRDRPGYLWSMGEIKVERSKAERVTLPEIEAAIASVDEVSQVAVIRYYNETEEPRVKAFVQLVDADDVTAKDKIQHVLIQRCGKSGLPDDVQFVSSLPYSRSGKLLRSVLRRISKGDPLRQEDLQLISDPQIANEYLKEYTRSDI